MLHDNTHARTEALRLSGQVLPCFIFDLRQIAPHPYQSNAALQFMLQSIIDLQQQLQAAGGSLGFFMIYLLWLYAICMSSSTTSRIYHRDYTPFSRRRDYELAEVCQKLGISLHTLPDTLLTEPEQAVKIDQTPYKVFTAFYNNARQFPVALPQALTSKNFMPPASDFTVDQLGLSQAESKTGRHARDVSTPSLYSISLMCMPIIKIRVIFRRWMRPVHFRRI